MSDARAKAEARRAKILARENNRLSLAKGETPKETVVPLEDEYIEENASEEVKASRPLARRRNLISSVALNTSSEDIVSKTSSVDILESSLSTEENKSKSNTTSDPDVESISEFETKVKKELNKQKVSDLPNTPVKSNNDEKTTNSIITPKNTKEIENEIREQTAAFDKNVISSSKSVSKNKKVVNEKKPVNLTVPLQASHIMKIIRILAIFAVAAFIGYRSATINAPKISALSTFNFDNYVSSSTAMDIDFEDAEAVDVTRAQFKKLSDDSEEEDSEYVTQSGTSTLASLLRYQRSFSTAFPDGTWSGWFQSYIIRQAESSITALNLAWWIARILSPVVDNIMRSSLFKTNNKGGGMLAQLLNIYAAGLEGLIEGSLGTIGEFSLQVFATILFSSLFTIYIIPFQGNNFPDTSVNSEL